MSHVAISAGPIGFPSFGACAKTVLETTANTRTRPGTKSLCVYMLHLTATLDRPTGDGVIVLAGERGDGWDLRRLAARRDEFGPGRLRVTSLVPGSTLQHRRTSI